MIFGSESAGAKNESNAAPSQIATRSAFLVRPAGSRGPSWAISESARGYLALMSGCIPAIICLSLGHESSLCWVWSVAGWLPTAAPHHELTWGASHSPCVVVCLSPGHDQVSAD